MRRLTFALIVLAAFSGCKTTQHARYIYQDGEFGVIGIPQNSPFGSTNFHMQAEQLMAHHFPEGYEIVRAEEVVEGQRVLDKSRKAEFESEPSINALSQKITLGKLAQTTSTATKDSLPILESRIIYKRRGASEVPGPNGFAASAEVIPKYYLDPNEMARCRERIELAELKKAKDKASMVAEKSVDGAVKKVAAETTKPDEKSCGDEIKKTPVEPPK